MQKLKRVFLYFFVILTGTWLWAQDADWARSAGSTGVEHSSDITRDSAGNSYVIGYFSSTATFGTLTLTSSGGYDIFIAKLSPTGTWLWAVRCGGTSSDYGYGIEVDDSGNVYATGYYNGIATFGSAQYTSQGGSDIFVIKLNTNGTWLWSRTAGGISADRGYAIALDNDSNAYITGYFYGTANFGGLPITSAGLNDVFTCRISSTGDWAWASRQGGTGSDTGYGILSEVGNVMVTGSFEGTASFGTYNLVSAGSSDVFIHRCTNDNSVTWIPTRMGGTGADSGMDVVRDGYNGDYVVGSFTDAAQFGSLTLTGVGQEIFVAKLSYSGGNVIWAASGGGVNSDQGLAIDLDDEGYPYICGSYLGDALFGSFYVWGSGLNDIFYAKLSPDGEWLIVRRCMTNGTEVAYGINARGEGGCVITGDFNGTLSIGNLTLTSAGNVDCLVAYINDPTPFQPDDISISNFGYDVTVSWSEVDIDTWYSPITPDYYFVYYNTDGTAAPYHYLTFVPDPITQYVHQHAGYFSSNHFYNVTAVQFSRGNRSDTDRFLRENLREGMTREEVQAVLNNASDR